MIKVHERAKRADKIATIILYSTAGFFLILLACMIAYILFNGLNKVKPEFIGFTGEGIGIQLFNTIYMVFIALVISVPIGVLAGIYLAEYSKDGFFTKAIRTCIETLSSLPSIVVGLFGYLVFVFYISTKFGLSWNLMAGAATISILNIPLITRITEDALRAVPHAYKEGSLAVGATKWQTIMKTLIPVSIPRIVTGIILAAGRGFGEAAALIYTAGMSSSIDFKNWNIASEESPLNPFRPADTLAVHIWALKSEGISENAPAIADLSAAVLILLVFVFSLGSRALSSRLEKKMLGAK